MMALEVLSGGEVRWNEDLVKEASEKHPDPGVRASAVLCLLNRANREKDVIEARKLYNRLQTEFALYPVAQYAKMLLNPDMKIREGEQIPDFAVLSLDEPGERYTNRDFRGKTLLIDFWATWCRPCVGEMPTLTQAYEEYKDKGLEILSVSFDMQPEKVASFRNGQWKMPWKNGFVPGAFDNPMAKDFEVTSIPKPVLVDSTGTILATAGKLRGRALETTLARVFRDDAP